MENRIRGCYDKEISYRGMDLCLMMARDACFILEIFRCYIWEFVDSDSVFEDGDFQIQQRFHPIFRSNSNPVVRSDIVKDLIKLENQIPLFVLEEILAMEMRGSIESAKYKLQIMLRPVFQIIYYRPFEFFADGSKSGRPFNHILDIYHFLCLGDVAAEKKQDREKAQSEEGNLEIRVKIPDAVELKNGGVKLEAARDGNIKDIKFEGRTLTIVPIQLYSEIYIRNLIAFENCSPLYNHRAMTAYAQFMEELCQTDQGVDVMRKEGIIYGHLWHHKRVWELWNSLNSSKLSALQAKCPTINITRAKLSSRYERDCRIKLAIVWNDFWKTPVPTKPWVVIGGIGGTIVLLLTAVQVFCLFRSCGAR